MSDTELKNVIINATVIKFEPSDVFLFRFESMSDADKEHLLKALKKSFEESGISNRAIVLFGEFTVEKLDDKTIEMLKDALKK